MIRELLVQDLPRPLRHRDEIPADWEPGILCSRQDVFEALAGLGHRVDRSRPERSRLELGPGRFLELLLGADELLFSFTIRFGDSEEEDRLAADLLVALGFVALEEAAPSGVFLPGRPQGVQSRA
ncbi:MAG: hypothetical protein H6807_01435 [Planctomycetes bacterium]|nr:hypothetical protein [Planctomycetota bacterium]